MTLGELAAGLAHQIRTPLAAALLYASQMTLPGRSAEDLSRCSEKTVGSLKQLDQLVNDMLAFAHGGAARELVSVSALLEQVAQWLRPALRRGVRLTIRTEAPGLTVRANAPSLVSALLNLATNALQAAAAESGAGTAGAAKRARPRRDRGDRRRPGVPAHIRERIFEPFFTTRTRGNGIGLVHRQERRRGACRAACAWPTRARGATFVIDLPAEETAMNTLKESVLIVEDDAALREALTDTLRAAGITTLAAADAREALKLLEAQEIALVISDVQMPGPSGYELLSAIRRLRADLPVVLMTAYGTIAQAVSAMREGRRITSSNPSMRGPSSNWPAASSRTGVMPNELVAVDPESKRTVSLARKIAETDATVLITGRERHRQGGVRALHPRSLGAFGTTLRRHQLRGHPREHARGDAVRLREGRVHRCARRACGQIRAGAGRHVAAR